MVTQNVVDAISDADFRNRVISRFPKFFDGYYLAPDGRILSHGEARRARALNHFLDGLSKAWGNSRKA